MKFLQFPTDTRFYTTLLKYRLSTLYYLLYIRDIKYYTTYFKLYRILNITNLIEIVKHIGWTREFGYSTS